jgi:hypothetical protein
MRFTEGSEENEGSNTIADFRLPIANLPAAYGQSLIGNFSPAFPSFASVQSTSAFEFNVQCFRI